MRKYLYLVVAVLVSFSFTFAQQTKETNAVAVPRLIRFAGQLQGPERTVGISFTLHKGQKEAATLWTETQNVKLDAEGRYSVLLGSTKADGLPVELFASGEAQWLGVRVEGQAEQPRVLLVSVPYALKAAEAETLAGHSVSEFVTNEKLAAMQQGLQPASGGTEKKSSGVTRNAISGSPTNFTGTTTDQIVGVTQGGTGAGISSNTASGYALYGKSSGTAIYGLSTATSAAGIGVYGATTSSAGYGLFGANNATTGTAVGVRGTSLSNGGIAVYGTANTATGTATGVKGITQSPSGYGVVGQNTATTGNAMGIRALSASASGYALVANETAPSGSTTGLLSTISSPGGTALVVQDTTGAAKLISGQSGAGNTEVFAVDTYGHVHATASFNADYAVTAFEMNTGYLLANTSVASYSSAVTGYAGTGGGGGGEFYGAITPAFYGVQGYSGHGALSDLANSGYSGLSASGGVFSGPNGVIAITSTKDGTGGYAVTGIGADSNGVGVTGINLGATGFAVYGSDKVNASGSYAGFFSGKVYASGTFTHAGPAFQIVDHPADPANKTLTHASVESSEMKNIYDGVVTTDASGEADVVLPSYMEAYNHEFRYQLTAIGQFAQAIVSREIQNSRFTIKTDKPLVKVSWQVTGVRNDAYAKAHPLEVESEKPESQRGRYFHPVENGAAAELTIGDARMRENLAEAKAEREKHPRAPVDNAQASVRSRRDTHLQVAAQKQ
ncbi:hypothetical protein Acid345_0191 [Candidatus Koribacter versatilis Ellin345]|uniref:Uncharacterized protein n=1 Tax=Koribacter versatilis (strain Ellin345) TaxID=204669 RepID=Q1IVA4_KORVE|nr:hypothetical protein [Candidatus Koribacter versatilis]ABF39196.1 hypothetical protein Acid345_0191 [Candidatus Koribacter versatilis Ellin345]